MSDFNFDEWFQTLEEEPKQQYEGGSSNKDYVKKIYSNYSNNWGTIYCIPFTSIEGKPLTDISGMMKVKLAVEGTEPRTQMILPKEFYSFLPGSKEDQLHGELVSLFRSIHELKGNNYSLASWCNYYLMYAYVLRHVDQRGEVTFNKVPSLLVMCNKKFKNAWIDDVKEKTNLEGSTSWVNKFYNRSGQNKMDVLKITIKRPDNYLFNVAHEEITRKYHGMTDGEDYVNVEQSVIDSMFLDPVNDLLRVNSKDERFNYDWYVKVKDAMVKKLAELRATQITDVQEPEAPVREVDPLGSIV